MAEGWIKIHRKIINWQWYNDSPVKDLFLHLLLTANHKDKVWRGKNIKRGQLITSSLKLSTDVGLTRQQVRTALNKLKSTNEITIESTNLNICITVVNIEKYNSINQRNNKQTTKRQPTINQRATTTKNEKNVENEKKVVVSDPFFEMFRRVTGKHISDEELILEIARFKNKYPNIHPNKAGALINNWVSRIGEELPVSKDIKNSSFI